MPSTLLFLLHFLVRLEQVHSVELENGLVIWVLTSNQAVLGDVIIHRLFLRPNERLLKLQVIDEQAMARR